MVSMATERSLRLTVKLLQFMVSLYLIFSLYNTGPHWILLIACLAVPIYGIYLMVKSPDRTLKQHPVPFVRYKALARNKNWLRVDIAISLTMACVCFGFSAILFFGYFKVNTATLFYLQAAVASLLLSILYLFNSLLSTRQIEMGTIDFIINNDKQPFSTQLSRTSPLAINTDFGQSERYLQEVKTVQPNYNVPPHKSSVSSLTLLERLQIELAQRKLQDNPINKPSIAESTQENYFPHSKSSKVSDSTDEEKTNQRIPATHKYSEDLNTTGMQRLDGFKVSTPLEMNACINSNAYKQDYNNSELNILIPNVLKTYPHNPPHQQKFSEMPASHHQQQPLGKKHQSRSSCISPHNSSSQPYNRTAVPAAKTGWTLENQCKYSGKEMMAFSKRRESGEEQQRDGLSSILKKSSAATSPIDVNSSEKLEELDFSQNSTTNSSSASNHFPAPPASSFTHYHTVKTSPERGIKILSSDFTTYMPVYSRKLDASEPIKTAIHRAVPVKVRSREGGDTSQSDSSTGESSTAEFERKDGKGSSQTVRSSQGSTARMDDFEPLKFDSLSNSLSTSNRMTVSKSTVTRTPAEHIMPIAAAIDSGRERQRLALGTGTRFRERIKNRSDGTRPRSMPFQHSSEINGENSLTEVLPPTQVTQF